MPGLPAWFLENQYRYQYVLFVAHYQLNAALLGHNVLGGGKASF